MKYTRLGNTGLNVSRLCLGCMTYGDPKKGHHDWVLDEEHSRPFYRQALEGGINFFDTANIYSNGASEEVLGRALKELARRDEVVVATKAYFPWGLGPNTRGNSRKALFAAIDASLKRLDMEYVDLLQIHRWDDEVPAEETMEALHDIVKAGKALHIGASSMHAWQFARAQEVARSNGWTPFVSMQNHLNLLYREEEREMIPLCHDESVGLIPWSPLARGKLARAWDETTQRNDSDAMNAHLYGEGDNADRAIVEAVGKIAEARGVSRATVGLAWHFTKGVAAPIIGASKPGHMEGALASVDLELTDGELGALEGPYCPKKVSGLTMPTPPSEMPTVKG